MGWLSINKWFCFLVNKLNIKQIIQSGTLFVCCSLLYVCNTVLCTCWLLLRHPLFSPFNSTFKHITLLEGTQQFWRHNSCAIFWTHGQLVSLELFIYFMTRSVITAIIWVIMSKSYNSRCNLSLANPSMSVTLLRIKWILSQKGLWVVVFLLSSMASSQLTDFFFLCVFKNKSKTKPRII